MKKHFSKIVSSMLPSLFVIALLGAVFYGPIEDSMYSDVDVILASHDTPGDGFDSGDSCGYLYGSSRAFNNGQMIMNSVKDDNQVCFDKNGYAYEDKVQNSIGRHSILGYMDFAWDASKNGNVQVDSVTGQWSGNAKLSSTSYEGKTLNPWVWFDWKCKNGATDPFCKDPSSYYVTTDSAGNVSGYAWNDTYGYIDFTSLQMEMPPQQVVAYIDVFANDAQSVGNIIKPSEATIDNAPMADAYQPWYVRVMFLDTTTGLYLTAADINTLSIEVEETADSNIYLNQVKNTSDAVVETTYYELTRSSTCNGAAQNKECIIDVGGNDSFNTFVYSGAPTSNMLLMQAENEYVDRDGCVYVYDDAISTCPQSSTSSFDKSDVFFLREGDRNQYIIDDILLKVDFVSPNIELVEDKDGSGSEFYASTSVNEPGWYYYEPDAAENSLSWRPRYMVNKYVAKYSDGVEYTDISDNLDEKMTLISDSNLLGLSDEYRAASVGQTPEVTVYEKMDVDSLPVDPQTNDTYLLIDGSEPLDSDLEDTEDDTDRKDTVFAAFDYDRAVNFSFAIGYGQLPSECWYTSTSAVGSTVTTGICGNATNTVSSPTAEQWVCDDITANRDDNISTFGANSSCYFTAYLPLIDFHTDPLDLTILGSINSTLSSYDFDDDSTSILGSSETITMRNNLYAQIARYTLGKTGFGTGGTLDADLNPSGGIISLLGGRLLYAEGDVYLTEEVTSAEDISLVIVGGNFYADYNATGGKLGVIVLKDDGGNGGNVYVHPRVTDLYANLFLDGSFYSYDGSAPVAGVPTYSSKEARIEVLQNTLYLKGSLVSRNTVGGSGDVQADGTYPIGDGTYSDYDTALQSDLNMIRQFRMCYPTGTDGLPDTSAAETDWVLCGEGEQLSQYAMDNADYSSFILEYDPPGNLPVYVTNY